MNDTNNLSFHPVWSEAAQTLNRALAALSEELGDAHAASDDEIARALSGPHPAAHGMLARKNDDVVGAALYSANFSTVYGPEVYVSDLWIAPKRRSGGLGPQLLSAVFRDAERKWGARRLKLNVYHSSTDARRFYAQLGFSPVKSYTAMVLNEHACARLKDLA